MTSTTSQPETTGPCQVHGGHAKKANLTLLAMITAGFAMIIWHVWVYGPAGHVQGVTSSSDPFLSKLGVELWNLLTDKHGILAELWDIFPYFISGILLAGYIRTFKIAVKLQLTLRRYGVMSVFLASFIGIITPLCACGTLTTAISLLFAGVPLAPVMAILVTSPLMSPSTYLLTLNDLGAEWTVIRTAAAFSMGIFAGLVTHFLKSWGFETKNVFIDGGIVRGDFHDEDYPDERLRCGCKQNFGNRVALRTSNKFLIFLAKSYEMLWLVGKYVLVGVIIGAIVERYTPNEWIYRIFGRKDSLNVLWITLASVPMFLHQISASSIIFHIKSSLGGTLDSGAALAFMIGGPVTALPTMVMFWTIFKKRVFVLYMFVCLAGTLLITYSLQALLFVPGVDTGNALLKGVGSLSGGNSAVITKSGEDVRIVMDPSGKPLIATYAKSLGTEGAVVFDASLSRFTSGNTGRYDNGKYIRNIAGWLEENSSTKLKGSILAYDFSSGRSNVSGQGLKAIAAVDDREFSFTDRKDTPLISKALLEKHSQVWLFFGEGVTLSEPEIEALASYSKLGGALLIAVGDQITPRLDNLNRISSTFGVTFHDRVKQNDEIPVAVASPLLYQAAEFIGRALKLTHKA